MARSNAAPRIAGHHLGGSRRAPAKALLLGLVVLMASGAPARAGGVASQAGGTLDSLRVLGSSDPAAVGDGRRVLFILTRRRDDLGDLALAVSDPASPQYGNYRRVEEIASTYGASHATIDRVAKFLARYGATAQVDVTGTFSSSLLTRDQIEAIFGKHPPISPEVPAELKGAVVGIIGNFESDAASALDFPGPIRGRLDLNGTQAWPDWAMGSGTPFPCPSHNPVDCTNAFPNPGPASAFRSFTPDQLRTAYGIAATGLTGSGRHAVVAEFGQAVDGADIDAFTKGFGLPQLNLNQVLLDGPREVLHVGGEATLDVETIVGLAPDIAGMTLITAPARTEGEFLVYWLMVNSAALDKSMTGGALTDALSISYTVACETENPSELTVKTTELLYQTAAAAGVTVAIAAGDQGSSECTSRRPPYADRGLALAYPGSSPWVTSLGGTNILLRDDNSLLDAQVWNDWPLTLDVPLKSVDCSTPPCRPQPVWSGAGGESILFDRPSWQTGFGVDPNRRRQVPDLALLADIYPGTLMHFQGSWSGQGNGTSQAAPTFAAMTLLLDEYTAARRRPRIGFASPLVYALAAKDPQVFFDVIQGNNIIGDNDKQFDVDCCFAKPGYDEASGWGPMLVDRAVAALSSKEPVARRLPSLRSRPTS